MPQKTLRHLSEASREDIRKAFDLFDHDGTGMIDAMESLKVTLRVMGVEAQKEDLIRLIAQHTSGSSFSSASSSSNEVLASPRTSPAVPGATASSPTSIPPGSPKPSNLPVISAPSPTGSPNPAGIVVSPSSPLRVLRSNAAADLDEQHRMLDFNTFLSIVASKMEEPMPREEVSRAFRLFTGGDARPICVRDVAAVAEELGIKMSSEELEEMVLQALPADQLRDIMDRLRKTKPSTSEITVGEEDFRKLMLKRE